MQLLNLSGPVSLDMFQVLKQILLLFQIQEIYDDLLDGFLVDIASEVHREAALGPAARPPDERPPLPEPSLPPGLPPIPVAKIPKDCRVDVFGQIIPPVPLDKFNCQNCGSVVVASRYAPHLEKCMGKVRPGTAGVNRILWGRSECAFTYVNCFLGSSVDTVFSVELLPVATASIIRQAPAQYIITGLLTSYQCLFSLVFRPRSKSCLTTLKRLSSLDASL